MVCLPIIWEHGLTYLRPAFAEVSLQRRTAKCECRIRASLRYSLSVDRWSTCWVRPNSEFALSDWLTPGEDDHDIIDGFGSYPESLQTAPLFSLLVSPFLLRLRFFIHEVVGSGLVVTSTSYYFSNLLYVRPWGCDD